MDRTRSVRLCYFHLRQHCRPSITVLLCVSEVLETQTVILIYEEKLEVGVD
jgi:hypothetical protein